MGAWDEGLYDNDEALDELGDLLAELDLDDGPVALATVVGLRAWLDGPSESLERAVRKHTALLPRLPKPARELLELLLRDGEAFARPKARSDRLKEVLGEYCDGPKYDALLSLPGAEVIIADLVKRAAEGLDDRLDSARDGYDVSAAGAHLGVLLELATAGLARPPAARVKHWRRAVERIDEATAEEREHFDAYFARFRRGLSLLDKATQPSS